jgi:chitinase
VHLDGLGSTDPDSDTITTYRFNFGDGTPLLTQTSDATVDHTYPSPGEYRAILQVRDSRGMWSANDSFKKIVVEDEQTGPPPSLRINDLKKLEGDSGHTAFVFTVTRTGDTDEPSAVRYHTEAGSGTVPEDFVNISNATLSFGAGATSRTLTVQVVGDGKRDADDKFFVVLTSPTNATIADGRGKGTILNDDPYLIISNLTIDEPTSGTVVARFRVTLSYATPGRVTVHFRTRNGTARAGSDFTAVSNGTLRFAPGQTVKYATVVIKSNAPNEPNERFFVDLFNVTNAFIKDGSAKGIIRD